METALETPCRREIIRGWDDVPGGGYCQPGAGGRQREAPGTNEELSEFASHLCCSPATFVGLNPVGTVIRLMKTRNRVIITALIVSLFVGCSKRPQAVTLPDAFQANQLRFNGAYPVQALEIYANLAKARLDISPAVKSLQSRIYWTNQENMTRSQLVAKLEMVLGTQAGVVMRHVDARHIKVTYDAAARGKPSE